MNDMVQLSFFLACKVRMEDRQFQASTKENFNSLELEKTERGGKTKTLCDFIIGSEQCVAPLDSDNEKFQQNSLISHKDSILIPTRERGKGSL